MFSYTRFCRKVTNRVRNFSTIFILGSVIFPCFLQGGEFDSLLRKVNGKIYYGAEPGGAESFETLKKLGIRTIVSVDGAKPDVEEARRFGLRYVHIPFGYDGIPSDASLSLVKVMQESRGAPVFIHCHHGKHRGPAAAAIACRASDPEYSTEDALSLLWLAGTNPDYTGLWRDVGDFVPPDGSIPLPELEEVAETDSLIESMAALGRAFDDLKLLEKSEWQPPRDHPDLVPQTVAILAWEAIRESRRFSGEDYAADYHKQMKDSETSAVGLIAAIRDHNPESAARHFQSLKASCKTCHREYRD